MDELFLLLPHSQLLDPGLGVPMATGKAERACVDSRYQALAVGTLGVRGSKVPWAAD